MTDHADVYLDGPRLLKSALNRYSTAVEDAVAAVDRSHAEYFVRSSRRSGSGNRHWRQQNRH
jgi:hypothetical protein